MKDVRRSSVEDSVEASECWSDGGGLGRKDGGLEGRWYWNSAGEAFRRQQMRSMAVDWLKVDESTSDCRSDSAKFRDIRTKDLKSKPCAPLINVDSGCLDLAKAE